MKLIRPDDGHEILDAVMGPSELSSANDPERGLTDASMGMYSRRRMRGLELAFIVGLPLCLSAVATEPFPSAWRNPNIVIKVSRDGIWMAGEPIASKDDLMGPKDALHQKLSRAFLALRRVQPSAAMPVADPNGHGQNRELYFQRQVELDIQLEPGTNYWPLQATYETVAVASPAHVRVRSASESGPSFSMNLSPGDDVFNNSVNLTQKGNRSKVTVQLGRSGFELSRRPDQSWAQSTARFRRDHSVELQGPLLLTTSNDVSAADHVELAAALAETAKVSIGPRSDDQ